MAEPRFGNCRDCACWNTIPETEWNGKLPCYRHPPTPGQTGDFVPYTVADHGCFDYIPTTEDRNG
jgi:hypothetical protein